MKGAKLVEFDRFVPAFLQIAGNEHISAYFEGDPYEVFAASLETERTRRELVIALEKVTKPGGIHKVTFEVGSTYVIQEAGPKGADPVYYLVGQSVLWLRIPKGLLPSLSGRRF